MLRPRKMQKRGKLLSKQNKINQSLYTMYGLYFLGVDMRYHYEKPEHYTRMYGKIYNCDHPLYSKCTLYCIRNKGLAVVQQRFNSDNKSTYWSNIDPWLTDNIYLNPRFKEMFDIYAGEPNRGLYPTISVRQIMWLLRMKPLKRKRWETYFDRKLL